MSAPVFAGNMGLTPKGPVGFRSILFPPSAPDAAIDGLEAPDIFADLNLDQVVEAITAGRETYNLKPFFYLPLSSVDSINYRHEVLRDLDKPELAANIRAFARDMQRMRDFLLQGEKLYYQRQKQRWLLDAAEIYCDAVDRLHRRLASVALGSEGFRGFLEYLSAYVGSSEFCALVADTRKIESELRAITYCLHIKGRRITVGPYSDEQDYGAEVLATFEKFSQRAAKEYRFDLRSSPEIDHVEAAVLDLVARRYPETFSRLEEYAISHKNYLNAMVASFDREVQFYLACLEFVERFKPAGLAFCYPSVSDQSKEIGGKGVFDLALALKLIQERSPVIPNDFCLRNRERVLVVSGPNQGGKTTFARTFGQLHYLASLGCRVPGSEVRLFLFDRIFTHFEREEDIGKRRGKLEDELSRIHQILKSATPRSILIMNESFLSTTLSDALFLSRRIMERVIALDMLCVSVTFLDEVASMDAATVSMVATVDPNNPARRTFKLIRRPADGLAYAMAIAEKYRLTHDLVKARILENTERAGSA